MSVHICNILILRNFREAAAQGKQSGMAQKVVGHRMQPDEARKILELELGAYGEQDVRAKVDTLFVLNAVDEKGIGSPYVFQNSYECSNTGFQIRPAIVFKFCQSQ